MLLAIGSVSLHCESSPPPRAPLGHFVDLGGVIESDAPFRIRAQPGQLPEAINASFADIDEDGQIDVVVAPSVTDLPQPGDPPRVPRFYHYDSLTQQLVPSTSIPTPTLPMQDAISLGFVFDLDADGHADVVDSWARVAWGTGHGMFTLLTPLTTDVTMAVGAQAVSLDDIDGDGWLDMLLGGAQCCESCRDVYPMLATSPRTFAMRADLVPDGPIVGPYAVLAATVGSGEKLLAALGAGCSDGNGAPAFYRRVGFDSMGYPRFEAMDPTPPDAQFRANSSPTLVSISGRSPMGAVTGDIDGDGLIDLAVMLNPDHTLLRGQRTFPFEDRTLESGIQSQSGDHTRPMLAWGTALLDLDRDGRLDLLAAHGNDFGAWMDPESYIGPQWLEAYRNRGDFHFEPIGAALGLDRRGQWKALAVGDLDGDGDPDLAVGGQGEWPRIYRNEPDPSTHGFAVRLRGTTSNAYGIGSVVEVHVDGLPVQYHVMGGSGSPWVVSEPLVFPALGQATQADRVTVRWVSGYVQEVGPLTAGGIHTIVEPEWIAVRPTSRHLPADGHSAATIHVDAPPWPYLVQEVVSITLPYGTGTLGPVTQSGTGYDATITAPSSPGSGVIEVRVNGAPAGVRPRIFWD